MIGLILILISALTLSLVIIYIITQLVNRTRSPESILVEESPELQDFLKIFTKPQTITKEEVKFSIEKKICLVCKSRVSRLNYVCPDCEVLYCVRCSNALSNLENACWVCETPFDKVKSKEKGGNKDIV